MSRTLAKRRAEVHGLEPCALMSLLIHTTPHEPQRDMCIPQPCTIKGLVPALYRAKRATQQQQSHNKRWEQFSLISLASP